MNITNEKEHIYQLMKELISERRSITHMYYELKERLNELTKLEQRGLTDLNIKGYTDLYNNYNKETATNNIQREASHQINKINKETEQVNNPKPQPKYEKEITKQNNNKSKKKRTSLERIISIITEILRESSTPISTNQLWESVNNRLGDSYHISKSNFGNNIMYRINQRTDTRIEKAHRGYYQYKR